MSPALNRAGLSLIEAFEGLKLAAYKDVAGIWTIGYGHTGPEVKAGLKWTQQQAEAALMLDVQKTRDGVWNVIGNGGCNENQFAAMVSLTYNIGVNAFRTSTVLRLHKAADWQGAADAFMLWDKAHVDGQLVAVAGLQRRRSSEAALYMTGIV